MVNGTLDHFVLGLVSLAVSALIYKRPIGSLRKVIPAVAVWILVEAVQADCFRMGLSWFTRLDTIHDIAMDTFGGTAAYLILRLARKW